MSARDRLSHELAILPDSVAQDLLDYLHSTRTTQVAKEAIPAANHFDTHWSRWYGRCEDQEWQEPEELPLEIREDW